MAPMNKKPRPPGFSTPPAAAPTPPVRSGVNLAVLSGLAGGVLLLCVSGCGKKKTDDGDVPLQLVAQELDKKLQKPTEPPANTEPPPKLPPKLSPRIQTSIERGVAFLRK